MIAQICARVKMELSTGTRKIMYVYMHDAHIILLYTGVSAVHVRTFQSKLSARHTIASQLLSRDVAGAAGGQLF